MQMKVSYSGRKNATKGFYQKGREPRAGLKAGREGLTLILREVCRVYGQNCPHLSSCWTPALKGEDGYNYYAFVGLQDGSPTRPLLLHQFHQCFAPEVRRHLSSKGLPCKVLLLLGNDPGHPELMGSAPRVSKWLTCPQIRHPYLASPEGPEGPLRPIVLGAMRKGLSMQREGQNITAAWKDHTMVGATIVTDRSWKPSGPKQSITAGENCEQTLCMTP